jgi:type IV pilus assembly protein PilM
VEANIPIALKDAYFDWEIISPLKKSVDHFDILISAAPRDLVDSYIELFRKAGIKPLSFEPESLALARCLIKGEVSEKPILIVDLGQTRTNFIIYSGRGLRFTSSIEISEDIMTMNIARSMSISTEDAEKLKKEVGMNRDDNEKVFEAIVPVMTDLKEQINSYIDFYAEHAAHVHSGGEAIAKVLLSGGGARLKGIEKYLTTALRVPAEIGSPWVNILEPPLRETPELPYLESIRYATALGLALI